MLKNILITGAVLLGMAGTLATDTGKEFIKCVGKDVQYSSDSGYYCASAEQMTEDWTREEAQFKNNETMKEDYIFLSLVAENDPSKKQILKNDLVDKYNTETKEFDGNKMDSDFNLQLQFAVQLAAMDCGRKCQLTGSSTSEMIYNLLLN